MKDIFANITTTFSINSIEITIHLIYAIIHMYLVQEPLFLRV